MAGAALATCFGQPVTERAGRKPCGRPTARQLELSPLGQRLRLERTPRPGRVPGPTRDPVTPADRPSRILPVPDSDHRRSDCRDDPARLSAVRLPAGRRDGPPARGRDGSGWPCPRTDPWAVAARAPRTYSRARHAGIGLGETGAAVTHRWHAHPDRIRTPRQPDPARSTTRIQQPRLRETQGTPVWEPGEAQAFAAGADKSGSYLDDLAPGGVRAAR
jgi:hypothetical protein